MCRLHVGARRERRQVKIHELCADGRRRVTFATDLRVAVLLNAFELCDASQCCALVVVVAVHVSTLLWRAVSRAGAQSHKGLIARGMSQMTGLSRVDPLPRVQLALGGLK